MNVLGHEEVGAVVRAGRDSLGELLLWGGDQLEEVSVVQVLGVPDGGRRGARVLGGMNWKAICA